MATAIALFGIGGLGGIVVARSVPLARAAEGHHEVAPEIMVSPQQILAEPNVTSALDPDYDRYLDWKEQFQNAYNIEYSSELSVLPQWGIPKSGSAGIDFVWTPTIIWTPFSKTSAGSGSFTFSVQQNQFWNRPNTASFQIRAGLLTPPSDWWVDTTDYAQLTYTHTLPGEWRWLSVTIGQYGFGVYDSNQYAGNAQTNFINYALAQNGTQAYVNADLGAYAQAATPERDLLFAGGFQGATNFTGSTITGRSLAEGKEAYFLAARWSPHLLAGGSYGLLWYAQPALPADELPRSRGLSFNAVQNVDAQWGAFLRANTATGFNPRVETSVAWGVIRNDPFVHNPLDQIGFGIARSKSNPLALGAPVRNGEWIAEAYYDYAIFKGLQMAPDVQLYFNPALTPAAGPEAVFTLRATATF